MRVCVCVGADAPEEFVDSQVETMCRSLNVAPPSEVAAAEEREHAVVPGFDEQLDGILGKYEDDFNIAQGTLAFPLMGGRRGRVLL